MTGDPNYPWGLLGAPSDLWDNAFPRFANGRQSQNIEDERPQQSGALQSSYPGWQSPAAENMGTMPALQPMPMPPRYQPTPVNNGVNSYEDNFTKTPSYQSVAPISDWQQREEVFRQLAAFAKMNARRSQTPANAALSDYQVTGDNYDIPRRYPTTPGN